MYYINSTPNTSGNYGNPMGQPFEGCVALPDNLLTAYIEARGFVIPTISNGTVTALETNREALDAYLADHTDTDPEPTPTTDDRVTALEAQIAQADETAIELYEAQLAQEETNAAQDEALIELYEMIGG